MSRLSANFRGILLMIVACGLFAVNDACSKYLLAHMPVSQTMALRGLIASGLLLAIITARGQLGGLRHALSGTLLARAAIEATGAMMYITALMYMKLADASAIQQAAPLFTTAIVVMAFGAVVGWQRWLAVAVGLFGVLLVIKPGTDSFRMIALLPLGVALLIAVRDLVTGRIPRHIPTLIVTLVTALVSMLAGFGLGVAEEWRPVESASLAVLATSGVMVVLGHMAAIAAFRGTRPDVISPFRYSNVLFAVALGAALFGQMPDGLSIIGIALVIGAGLCTLHDEWRHRPARVAPAAVPSLPALAKSKA